MGRKPSTHKRTLTWNTETLDRLNAFCCCRRPDFIANTSQDINGVYTVYCQKCQGLKRPEEDDAA